MLTVATVLLAGAAHAQLTPAAVTASSDDVSVAANATDGNTDTRWSASGNGQRPRWTWEPRARRATSPAAFFKGNERLTEAPPRVCLGER